MTRLSAVLVVVAMSMQGTPAQQRVPPDPDAMAPADLILFDSRTAAGSENIFVIRPDGSGVRQLTSAVRGSALSYARTSSWSSDRRRIVFEGYDEEGYRADRGDIYAIDADGTNLTRIDCPDDGGCRQPRWSPDNKHILFVVGRVREAESAVNSTGRRNTSMMRCCDAETETETVRPSRSACDAFAWPAAGSGA